MRQTLEAAEVVRRLGGTAEWRQILRHTTNHSVRRALAAGDLQRVARGTYVLATLPTAYAAAAAARGLVSHTSAAQHWKFDLLFPEQSAHVTVPRRTSPRRRRGVHIHYRDWEAAEDQGGVTSPLRTVLDCAAELPLAEALAIADAALRTRLVTPEELVAAAARWPGHGRQKMTRIAEHADGRAANPFESGLRAAVLMAGLTGFEPQTMIRTPELGARVDLADPGLKIVLEADSFEFHGSREALDRDCRRYDELVRCDWLVLRFSWEQVMFDPVWVGRVVADTCELRNRVRQTRPRGHRRR